jgi:dTDP-4-amino-4,6-dideoxygalactose transaminase
MKTIVPFNDTARIFNQHKDKLLNILSETAASGWWLLGKQTQDFAKIFAKYCGVNFCLPVANGTDALEIAIKSLLNNPVIDDEIITVANAGGYSSIACRLVGVTPVYADINPKTLLIDIESIKNCLSSKVKMVILTHLFGAVVNVHAVRRMLDDAGYSTVNIIEDCAQAHGAKLGKQRVGSLGDIATFSFYPTKNLGTMGDAGVI